MSPAHPWPAADRFTRRARTTVVLTTVALGVLAVISALRAAGAATDAGFAQVIAPSDAPLGAGQPLTSGGSATQFSLGLPAGAACTGDTANSNPSYLVQTYMVLASVDPASLTFDANGPIPQATGANFRYSLFGAATTDAYANKNTAPAVSPPGPGLVPNLPAFTLAVFAPGDIPAGKYNVGVACTHGPASSTQLDKYWNTQMVVAVDPNDAPAKIAWTASAPAPTTTTTSTTTVGGDSTSSTSSTTSSSSTSTTSSTSVLSTSSTSSTVGSSSASSASSTSSTVSRDSSSSTSSTVTDPDSTTTTTEKPTGFAGLARTGSNVWLALWALLFIDLGWWTVRRGRGRQAPPGS